ncbi:MAG: hypothetical protein RM368_37220 [Nostoc sp. DedSLP03]|uniref:hypothetical protein n=1 Tax=Nostoc sp. DedSLP03 TaxID=3075400 RepID=UPI002AD31619|nr:hypothetical protein [Nostoc sp. DedSLP03]MDZ7970508.1 hypothetical protein [Nostoc sp. DedSLP03]
MKVSQIREIENLSLSDVALGLDIDGGSNNSPTLRLISISSILALVDNSGDPISQTVIDAINNEIASLNTKYSNLNTSLQNLATSVNSLASQNTQTQITEINTQITNLVSTVNTLVSQNLNSQIADINDVVTDLNTNYTDYVASNNAALQALTLSLNSQITTLNTNLLDYGSIVNSLNSTVGNHSTAIANLFAATNAIVPQNYPTTFQHFHDTSKVITGGALLLVQQTASPYATSFQQNPAALGDSFSFSVLLKAGTYTFIMLVTRSSNKGDLQLYIDGTLAFNDFVGYNATQIYERVTRTITIANDGLHEFVFTVYKKNALSTGYAFLCSKFSVFKN